jgi:hypothetical protein
MTISPTQGPSAQQVLEQFRQGATQEESLVAHVDGQSFQVLAQGEMGSSSGGTRSVAWVRDDVDTTSMFVRALAESSGSKLSGAIAASLGLEPAPGKPLSSRVVQQALDMAQTGRQALAGVDFMTQLEHSAVSGGAAFRQVATASGVDPASLSSADRARIDNDMAARFQAAAKAGDAVPSGTASEWLRSLLAGRSDGAA